MTGRLDGKVVIITGAASRGEGVGTGKAMAIQSAREGAKVLLVNRSAERAESLRAEIAEEGGEASVFAADVTSGEDTEALVRAAEERYGRVDVLCNNVGVGNPATVEAVTEEDWHHVIDVNLTSAMLCARAAVPAMRRSGGGSIINISSIAGARGLIAHHGTGAAAYAAAKAGLHGLTRSIAADFATENIRCNCIVVGSVHTPMVAHLGEEGRQRRRKMVPMQTEGTAWDIAYGMVYLASDEARWVTGVLLPIDGGLINLRDWPR